MRILHITSITNPKANGVAVAVANYFNYEKKLTDVAVYNIENNVVSDIFSYNFSEYKNISVLPNGFDSPDLVIFHEVYKPAYLTIYKECVKRKIPYIIVPHGCLTRLSQKQKWLKKKIANVLLFNNFVKKSLAIQYLNENEKGCSIFSNHRYLIAGNGINVDKKKNQYKNKDFVYIGRYSVKHKGLDLLADIIAENRKWFEDNNVKVQLYGRDSGDGCAKLQKIISSKKISDLLIMNNAVYGDEKRKILLDAYAFVQPSRWEGQPIGVMEALSYGLPCIVTFNTSFGEYVNNNRCGVGVKFDGVELFVAIKQIFEDENFRNECASNTIVIERDYSWSHVIRKCLDNYRRLV